MKLLVHELTASGLEQVMVATDTCILVAVRPHIYRHMIPSGSLAIEVRDGDDNLLATSESVAINSIGSANYYHGYVRFFVNVGIVSGQTYKFKLVSSGGYTFNESAYIGWCNSFDLSKYDSSYTPTNSFYQPLDMELWKRSSV